MEFLDTNFNILFLWLQGGLMLGIIIFWAAVIFTVNPVPSKNNPETFAKPRGLVVFRAFAMVIGVSLVVTGLLSAYHTKEMVEVRENNFIANIKMKYDVDEVLIEDETAEDFNVGLRGTQKIIVTIDGKDVMFRVTQDSETSEPTMSDMPLMSGKPKGEVVTVDDILK